LTDFVCNVVCKTGLNVWQRAAHTATLL